MPLFVSLITDMLAAINPSTAILILLHCVTYIIIFFILN